MRVDICNKLPADHPLQPLNVAPADAEGPDEPAGSVSTNIATSSQSDQPTLVKPLNFAQTETETETCEPYITLKVGEIAGTKNV